MNDILVRPHKMSAYLARRTKMQSPQPAYKEYYEETPKEPRRKPSRHGIKTQTHTELSDEKCKKRYDESNSSNSHRKSSSSRGKKLIFLKKYKSIKELNEKAKSKEVELLYQSGKLRKQSYYVTSAYNLATDIYTEMKQFAKTHTYKINEPKKIKLELEGRALGAYIDEISKKSDKDPYKSDDGVAIMVRYSFGGRSQRKSSQKPDPHLMSKIIAERANQYLRVSTYSDCNYGTFSPVSVKKKPSREDIFYPKTPQTCTGTSFADYIDYAKEQDTTDHQRSTLRFDYHNGSFIKYLDFDNSVIYAAQSLLSRLRLIIYSLGNRLPCIYRIKLHSSIVELYAYMADHKDLFGGSPQWSALRTLLISKYSNERSRMEMSLRGNTNCFTLNKIAITNYYLLEIKNSQPIRQMEVKIRGENMQIRNNLRKMVEAYRSEGLASGVKAYESYDRQLILKLKYEYLRQCGQVGNTTVLERMAWIMAVTFLICEMRNSKQCYFTTCQGLESVYKFLTISYPLYNKLLLSL